MPRKTEKRKSKKNKTAKRKMRGGWKWPWQKEETNSESGEVNPSQKEGIKEEIKSEPVESSQHTEKKNGWFDWLKPKPKESAPPAPPATGGKRHRRRNKKQ